ISQIEEPSGHSARILEQTQGLSTSAAALSHLLTPTFDAHQPQNHPPGFQIPEHFQGLFRFGPCADAGLCTIVRLSPRSCWPFRKYGHQLPPQRGSAPGELPPFGCTRENHPAGFPGPKFSPQPDSTFSRPTATCRETPDNPAALRLFPL